MGMQINTNVSALNSYRNLSNTQNDLGKSLEKLSSGLRINRAADDAAGLAVAEGLRSQVGGLKMAARNAQDGISVIQTAEGGLTETTSILQRLRDLAVQAGNDSNNAQSREAITTEATALVSELGRIGQTTNFNGINLLSGDVNSTTAGAQSIMQFQVGADGDASSQIGVDFAKANVSTIAAALTGTAATFTIADAELVGGAQSFQVGAATVDVTLGAAGTYADAGEVATALNNDAAFSAAMTATVNADGDLEVTAKDGSAVTTSATGTGIAAGTSGTAGTPASGGLDFTTAAGAQASITLLDTQIETVSSARSSLGAAQNRFESTINTLNVSAENLTAAESRIRDTDMASEMVNYTRSNILSQAGTAMLAQANQSNQGVLQLLG